MSKRKALILGATGLVGKHCLAELLNTPEYTQVIALTRKPLPQSHPKLECVLSSFTNFEMELGSISLNDVYCCLGTTIKKAGSKEAFKQVDCELVVTLARLFKARGAEQFLVISSLGADPDSMFFYNRVKGEMEEALKRINFRCLHIFRPSLLIGERKEFRFAEQIGMRVLTSISPFLVGSLRIYRPIAAEKVARSMVIAALGSPDGGVYLHDSVSMNSSSFTTNRPAAR